MIKTPKVSSSCWQVQFAEIDGKIIGLYFAANWYPKCEAFTPVLALRSCWCRATRNGRRSSGSTEPCRGPPCLSATSAARSASARGSRWRASHAWWCLLRTARLFTRTPPTSCTATASGRSRSRPRGWRSWRQMTSASTRPRRWRCHRADVECAVEHEDELGGARVRVRRVEPAWHVVDAGQRDAQRVQPPGPSPRWRL